ncbi:Rpn family recombination-promoting nuclease/putative transposase [Pseudanabaenaceae cyanobacterium LEGE 13415]|nr:Rpn family recombination-promoting nuclease/putative transposase [Pseudanabaenaceae cyanobacterium LEGE 13415]
MKRDVIFYQLFQRFPNLFFDLIDRPQMQGYRFDSVEVKEPTFRIDGVFLPPESASPKTIFFVEVQFQRDDALYDRFFAELMLYLHRNPIYDDWYGVILLKSRGLEPKRTQIHRSLLNSTQVQRIYLNELGGSEDLPLSLKIIQLTLATKKKMPTQARQLIEQVSQEAMSNLSRQEIIDIVTTITVYKFSKLSRTEVEAMLGLNLEETRVYQEAKAEGETIGEQRGEQRGKLNAKLETVPKLIDRGLSVEEIAEILELTVEEVRQAAQSQPQ